MKITKLILLLFVFSLFLNACGSKKEEASSQTNIEQVYELVILTLTAQAPPTVSNPPTATPTNTTIPLPTATLTTLPTIPTNPVSNVVPCDKALFMGETIPDGTKMTPGQTFTKTWKLMNNGTCDWRTTYSFVYSRGEKMNGASIALPKAVNTGETIELSISMAAPTTAGTYFGYWIMKNASGVTFGEEVYVNIVVTSTVTTVTTTTTSPTTANTPTFTPTPTLTPEPSSTSSS